MPVQRCRRCGTARRGDLQVCVRCETAFPDGSEPADEVELALPLPAAPSPTQSHGTVMAALLAGFVGLGVLLYLSVRDVGPFTGRIVSTTDAGTVTRLVVEVTNEGDKAGHGKCRVSRVDGNGDRRADFQFLSQRVPARGTVTQTVEIPVEVGVHAGQVDC